MHAMALTETATGRVPEEAEDLATAARGADPKDAWALHALTQALEQVASDR